ncbi:hypothetical protein SASPL_139577 [Salvia splendens]|uniref:Alpha N-terminal protein methyltransferase 1 n=1 Tax=Salvia splendens TaxID=180675 RepID=A0A8X8WNM0_SALSN|nr:hypothetical protein SASPL_139577 [Salvia splendens]
MYHHLLHRILIPQIPPSSSPHKSNLTRVGISNLNCIQMDGGGVDSDGRAFTSAEEMWREAVGDGDPLKKSQWYSEGVGYWQGVEATVDGVLGGYGHVNKPDIKCSEAFLNSILAERFPDAGKGRRLVTLDCGSGIGRITKNLLIRYFNEVDLLEPVSHFLDTARENLAPENLMVTDDHKAVNFFCVSLQARCSLLLVFILFILDALVLLYDVNFSRLIDNQYNLEFTPEAERYDIIWIQWCIGHLSDDDLMSFFDRAKGGLKQGGLFILKENIARSGFVLDNQDKSITRSDSYFKQLFKKCGLNILKMKDQKGFPGQLFAVKMYALTTDLPKQTINSKSKKHVNRPGIIR